MMLFPKAWNFQGDLKENLSVEDLYESAICGNLAQKSNQNALVIHTGKYTGRVPEAKYFVRDSLTEQSVWWGKINQGISPENFLKIKAKVFAYLSGKSQLFSEACYVGADPKYRIPIAVISENPVYALFAKTMFIPEKDPARIASHQADFFVIHAPSLTLDPARDGTQKDAGVLISFSERLIIICGTLYAGEIKKAIFTVMSFLMPEQNVLPMHCSANFGKSPKDAAIFFGLSGTGKTTLSAAKNRELVGDDEHGWSSDGVFNFEGGCYAKVIHLSREEEPEIYQVTQKFGTLLENVPILSKTGEIDLQSEIYTENTRASYPIASMPHMSRDGRCGHPKHILMLSCDAFGIFPPVAKLTISQALYYFLAGYTAKVAGTESGIKEPQATFSTCFAAPFMPRHPAVYASLLEEKILKHKPSIWILNTGWSGGPYGIGKRMAIHHTRAICDAILNNYLAEEIVSFTEDPIFKFRIPKSCPGIPAHILLPKNTWKDPVAYDQKARGLAEMFRLQMQKLFPELKQEILNAGPCA